MAERDQKSTLTFSGGKVQPKCEPVIEAEKPIGDHVTYLPDPEDPPSTKWAGYTFHANIPKFVTDPEVLKCAATNRFFKLGKFDPADSVETFEERPQPKTSDQYRAHAIAWMKAMQSVDEMDRKWQGEETLRISCGVGTDDLEYLGSLFGPARAELRKRDRAQ